jgi:hypothetical protein
MQSSDLPEARGVKDQYVGDVNDYLKYALLRAITADESEVAVIWMLTPADGRTDGRRLAYLDQANHYRKVDPHLFDALRRIVQDGARTIAAVEHANILPNATFMSDVLLDGATSRAEYAQDVKLAARGKPLVFFDPDNGLEIASISKGRRNSNKYLYWSEARDFYHAGHSVLIYQHFPRRPRVAFIATLAQLAYERCGCPTLIALRTPHVAFLLLPQPESADRIFEELRQFSVRAGPFGTTVTRIAAD